MSAGTGEHHQQIIIVRRRSDDEDSHHGGVWKIAFADFMTAMMCFFLVMWLINAVSDDTRISIASYFNPVKLIDTTTGQPGLGDPNETSSPAAAVMENPASSDDKGGRDGQKSGGPAQETSAADLSKIEKHSDSHLFADPYAVLAEIAAETGTMQNISSKGEGGARDAGPATGASGGEAYRDPFAPDFWVQNVATSENVAEDSTEPQTTSKPGSEVGRELAPEAGDASTEVAADATTVAEQPQALVKEQPEGAAEFEKAQTLEDPGPDERHPAPSAVRIAEKIKQELAAAFHSGDKIYEGMTVIPTDKGVRLSVTDRLDFGMFEIGSAVPRRELVLAMEKIGKVLSGKPGKVIVEGHTDARPFKSETYDNWRLSSARAHSAYYMLVRGGVDERRFVEVAGLADRRLKMPEDPFAAANRRIEILLDIGG